MKSFEHEGVWWSPEEPSKVRAGTLRFNLVDGPRLNLIVQGEKAHVFPDLKSHDRLFGLTTDRKAVTLIRCHERSARGTLGAAPTPMEVSAAELIVGAHCNADPQVLKVSAQFRHLNEWYGRSGVRMTSDVTPPDFAAQYSAAPPILLYDTGTIRVSLRSGLQGGVRAHRAEMRERIQIDVEATALTPLSELRKIVQACGDLLSIGCLALCDVRQMVIHFPASDAAPAHTGTFHGVPVYTNRGSRKRRGPFVLFKYGQVEDRAPAMFSAWISQSEKLYAARVLYFAGVYGGGFVETKLIALTQAAEAFHRRFYLPGLYMPRAAFEEQVLKAMKAAIPVDLPPSFRQSLKDRLKYANEVSLRKRMRELVSDHADALKALVKCPSDWVDPIVNHRNEFTHFPVASETTPTLRTEPEELLRYNFFLRLLLEAGFMHTMGFSTAEIAERVGRCELYRQLSEQFFNSGDVGEEPAPA